jgi:hypothetical protein
MRCPECGKEASPGDVECSLCGEELGSTPRSEIAIEEFRPDPQIGYQPDYQPAPRSPAPPPKAIYLGLIPVVVLVLGLALAVALWRPHTGPTAAGVAVPSPADSIAAVVPSTGPLTDQPTGTDIPTATDITTDPPSDAPLDTSTSIPTAADTGPSTPISEEQAVAALNAYRNQDLSQVNLDGHWVAQLASKNSGMTDASQMTQNGTHTFYATDILAQHEALRRDPSLGNVLLLSSTDYGTRQLVNGQPLWVTFADNNFGTAAEVGHWCAAHFSGLSGPSLANVCTPRKLNPPA